METKKEEIKICPLCKNHLIIGMGYYHCQKCSHWFEDIDFLSKEEQEKADKECLECTWLVKTEFKKNDMPLYYCNCLDASKIKNMVEKMRDFRKCKFIKRKDEVVE